MGPVPFQALRIHGEGVRADSHGSVQRAEPPGIRGTQHHREQQRFRDYNGDGQPIPDDTVGGAAGVVGFRACDAGKITMASESGDRRRFCGRESRSPHDGVEPRNISVPLGLCRPCDFRLRGGIRTRGVPDAG